MKGFNDFKRIAVVCIPSEDELKRRIAEKEEKGNAFTVKESTINNLRGKYYPPHQSNELKKKKSRIMYDRITYYSTYLNKEAFLLK